MTLAKLRFPSQTLNDRLKKKVSSVPSASTGLAILMFEVNRSQLHIPTHRTWVWWFITVEDGWCMLETDAREILYNPVLTADHWALEVIANAETISKMHRIQPKELHCHDMCAIWPISYNGGWGYGLPHYVVDIMLICLWCKIYVKLMLHKRFPSHPANSSTGSLKLPPGNLMFS